MRKLYVIAAILPLLVLSSCQKENNNCTNSSLIFSELITSIEDDERAIEIYNISDKTLDLSKYSIRIYQGNSSFKTISLNGSLNGKTTYVVVSSSSPDALKEKANLISDDLYYDASRAITLNKGNTQLDILGIMNYRVDFGSYSDMVRKESFLKGRKTFVEYDYMKYIHSDYSHLGTIEYPVSEDELLEGPRLSQEDFDKPFALDDHVGNGGAMRVDLSYGVDGDTTRFNMREDLSSIGINYNESIRYLTINTPEIDHGYGAQPWGEAAKQFTNNILANSQSFAISSAKNYTIRETYGRLLAYVWVSDKNNPQPEDFTCLNFLIIKEGFSTFNMLNNSRNSETFFYKNIGMCDYMRNAESLAILLGKHVHGEQDPAFL